MTDIIPYVSKLFIYPIKSLDKISLETVTILKSGALKDDRRLAIFDSSGKFVNGKRNHKIHSIRSHFNLEDKTISLSIQGTNDTNIFHLEQDLEALTNWLSKYFGFPVTIKQNPESGFPDDTLSPGPTIISTATLEAIASWYQDLTVEEIRSRFRANIEISGVPAFWEDRLFTVAGKTINFQIGNVQFRGINPCQRCIVVTRDSQTGEPTQNFQQTFINQRRKTLPEWVDKSRFNHFYKLALNTRLPVTEVGKKINLGDQLKIKP
ncbi:MAG TPA: MOSC domain-containing protein [Cyanothece sp. UBA12306]|nr:MOSC domain-containing protein [Cyanothece sp. UBA12306]